MATKTSSSAALFLAANLLLFTVVTSSGCHTCPTPTPPKPKPCPPPPKPTPTPSPPKPTPSPPKPTPSPPSPGKCPVDTLKLAVCANVLSGLINIGIGNHSNTPCCSLLGGLVDLDAAVCLCTALKLNLLGINLNIPIDLSLILNYCDKKVPTGFQCS